MNELTISTQFSDHKKERKTLYFHYKNAENVNYERNVWKKFEIQFAYKLVDVW